MKTVKKDTQVVVKNILGETAEVLVTRLDDGRYQFKCDAYVIGEKCKGGFFHLRQAREVIPGKKLGNNIRVWPRLRKALHESGVKPVNVPGGESYPIHYYDEIVVPDYSMSGTHFFVIKKSDIGKYLERLPLDDAGKAHAEKIRIEKAEEEAEAYRQAHDPKCIAEYIGNELWYAGANLLKGEFIKITLAADDNSEFSVMYPKKETDLLWSRDNVAKVLCTAPETGIEYLSGWTAGRIDPKEHNRIRKEYDEGWRKYRAYLMPNPKFATEVRTSSYWEGIFSNPDNDGVAVELIAKAKKVILEAYDLEDNLLRERYVYDRDSKGVTKEPLETENHRAPRRRPKHRAVIQ